MFIKNLFIILSVLFFLGIYKANSQVGIGTSNPNGALEVNSSTNGVIVSNVALTSKNVASPVVNPNGGALMIGTLVWNTATAGVAPNNVIPGFYYWDGTSWVAIGSAGSGGSSTGSWTTTGNSGTTAGTNFIGTTDAVDFRIKTNSIDRWNISNTNNGQLQSSSLGTAASPIYSFSSQPTTGIFGQGTDVLGLSTAGTERVRIDNNGNVGIGTTPSSSSVLDMSSVTNKAMVAPNVALSSTTTATINSPASGAIVYNTATVGSGTTAVSPGYYYWNGTTWVSMTTGGQSSATYFSSAGLTVTSTSSLSYVPGFPSSIVIPANSTVLINCDIGVMTSDNTNTGGSVVDIYIAVDGAFLTTGGSQRIYVLNNTGAKKSIRYASMSQSVTLSAGTHTFGIAATGVPIGGGSNPNITTNSSATVGGGTGDLLQGELTVTVLKK